MSTEQPPVTGLVAGKYELIKMIGRGGMGSVWEGRHTSLGTQVAIKFIDAEYANNEEARKRFDNEARSAAALQSKHAIQVYDHGVTEDGKPYIVMEFLHGEPLDKRIDRMRRLSLQDTARIMQQVCRALGKAHELGIVHRDLKPENIYLVRTEEDDDEIAKVLDFGIAKMKTTTEQGVSSSTRTGAVLGTPYYMSPEQARGLRTIDHRTDLWSLGVIAFKCITGSLPFEGESLGDLLVKICTAPLPVPSRVAPGIPPSFDAWFARALDREPARRFATAQELSDALALACGVSVRRGNTASSQSAMQPYVGGNAQQGTQSNPNAYASPAPYATAGQYASPAPYTQSGGGGAGYGASQPYGGSNPGYATPQPQLQQGVGGGTQAPFTASAHPPQKSGMSAAVLVAAIGAGVIGIGLGIFGVVKLNGGESSAGSGGTATTASPPKDPPTAVLNLPTTPPTDTGISPLTLPSVKPTTGGYVGPRPTSTGTTKPSATTTTTATAPTTTTTATVTATAKPTTTKPDFGPGF